MKIVEKYANVKTSPIAKIEASAFKRVASCVLIYTNESKITVPFFPLERRFLGETNSGTQESRCLENALETP